MTFTAQGIFEILLRDGFTCQFCGDKPGHDRMEVAHCIPVLEGGSDSAENLVAACNACADAKEDLIAFPKRMQEGEYANDPAWTVHRSFGEWRIVYHQEHGIVLEYAPNEYWIGANRAHEPFWDKHVLEKSWAQEQGHHFVNALMYFRLLTKSTKDISPSHS